jgi:hypothetical protein
MMRQLLALLLVAGVSLVLLVPLDVTGKHVLLRRGRFLGLLES